jgi:hypothetical protein
VDEQTWGDLVEASTEVHTELMAEGFVTIPRLMPLAAGRLVGVAHLRPVTQGTDATIAIGEMAELAAAASADEVVAAWETLDLSIACQHPPFHPGPTLNMVWATPGHHVLWRFPYQVSLAMEKSPVVARLRSPLVAREKSSPLARRVGLGVRVLGGDGGGANQSPHRPGVSIEVCEGTDGHHCRLP